jgi:hypothetical protein
MSVEERRVARPHQAKTVALARRLYESGWGLSDVARIIHKEHGVYVHRHTVRYWVDPRKRERQYRADLAMKNQRRAIETGGRLKNNACTPEFIEARVRSLRGEVKLGHRAIRALLKFDLDINLSEDRIRAILKGPVT